MNHYSLQLVSNDADKEAGSVTSKKSNIISIIRIIIA